MCLKKTLAQIFLVSFIVVTNAQDNVVLQNYKRFNVQYAGNIGFLSVGIGKDLYKGRILGDLYYGYLPKHNARSQVHTVAAKTSIIFGRMNIQQFHLKCYVGSTLTCSFTDNTYLRYPSYFPENYYDFPNSLHLHPYAGLLCFSHRWPVGYYVEVGSSDYKIVAALRNTTIGKRNLINIAFGVSYFWSN